MDVGRRYKLAEETALEVGPNRHQLGFICQHVFMQDWALTEGNLHRALASKILAAYSRTPEARPMIPDPGMFLYIST